MSRLAVAAGIVLVGALLLGHLGGIFDTANVAYGMTDLPALLKGIRTLHVESTQWLYEDDPNRPEFEHATVVPCEVWVDVPTLRTHSISFMSWRRQADGVKGLNRLESVHTAEYAMSIDHTKRLVWFNKASKVQRRLAVRNQIERNLHRISEEELAHFVMIGQETINGTLYNIWEREGRDLHQAETRERVRCWMAPATGELGRIYIWRKEGNGRWRLGWCADTIERNIEIPESVFAFDAPEGYRHQNTLETATLGEGLGAGWYFMGGARVCVAIGLTLDDGSVIVGWHSDDLAKDRHVDQSELFRDLVPGGELPKLPMVIYGLKTIRHEVYSPPETVYTGCHLAHTKKDGWSYEWGLFVPPEPVREKPECRSYRMLCRFNLGTGQAPQRGNPMSEIRIAADEFDDFVRAAMAELSDDGVAPEHVTYENVMKLVEQIRSTGDR
jgi:hypothetical protein